MVRKMEQRLAGGGIEEETPMQGVPGDLVIDAQVEAAGVEAEMAQERQPEKGGQVE